MPDFKLSPTRPRIIAIVASLLAIGIVASGIIARRSESHTLNARAASQGVPVVQLVKPSPIVDPGIELPARIEAWARAPIHARVSGYLKRWSVDIGATVKAGQLLGEIETPELHEQLAQARAELAAAQTNATLSESTARRWQSLVATDAVSRQEADEKAGDMSARRSAVNAMQANVDRIQSMRQSARLVAPFDGVVTTRNTDVGSLISVGGAPGSELFVISQTRKLRVYVQVPQRQIAAVRIGSTAQLVVPERPGTKFSATVESVSGAIQSGSGGMLVQLAVDNQAGELFPGSFATVRFAQNTSETRLGLPPSALVFGKEGARIATAQDGERVMFKPVKVVRDYGSLVELEGGLSREDRIIDSPPDGLADGDLVRFPSQKSAEPA